MYMLYFRFSAIENYKYLMKIFRTYTLVKIDKLCTPYFCLCHPVRKYKLNCIPKIIK